MHYQKKRLPDRGGLMSFIKKDYSRNKLSVAVISTLALLSSANSVAEQEFVKFDVKAGIAGKSLVQLAEEASIQIFLPKEVDQNVELPSLEGEFSVVSALDKILKGTGLTYEFMSPNSVVISNVSDSEDDTDTEEAEEVDEEIFVTGSRLKVNSTELSGNRVTLDREYIERSGEATLSGLLRKLPQSSNNTTNVYGADLNGTYNRLGATAINLRGLGTNNTLILVDGRRIGTHSISGGITDISAIPLSRVDRVDILLEGASAIYGSDAVGGVINIITRKEYQGVEISLDYNQPARGVSSKGVFSINSDYAWDGGRTRFGLEYRNENPLDAASVPELTSLHTDARNYDTGPHLNFFAFDDLGPVTIFYTGPNNITIAEFNALSVAEQSNYTPVTEFTAPDGWDGADLDAITIFEATTRTLAERGQNRTLIPESQRYSINWGIEQDLTDDITADLGISYSERKTLLEDGNAAYVNNEFNADNPFNPFGVAVDLSGWLPGIAPVPQSYPQRGNSLNANLTLRGDVADTSWSWEVTGGYSRNISDLNQENNLDSPSLSTGVGSDGLPTSRVFFADVDECLSLGGTPLTPTICRATQTIDPIDPFNVDYSTFFGSEESKSKNTQKRFEFIVRGNPITLPAGEVNIAAGGNWQETIVNTDSAFIQTNQTVTALQGPVSSIISRTQKSVFLEGFVPLISSDNSLPGVNSLSANFSARYDNYSNPDVSQFGETVDPCDLSSMSNLVDVDSIDCETSFSDTSYGLGFVYTPVDESLRFRFNLSTSFVAPQVNQLFRETRLREGFILTLNPPPCPEGYSTEQFGICLSDNGFIFDGGNPTLKPETSKTMSFGADFEPEFIPGLKLNVTWSDLNTDNRIAAVGTLIVDDPTNPPAHLTFLPDGVFINDFRSINVSQVEREGVDIGVRYDFESSMGRFDFQANFSRTLKFKATRQSGEDPVDLLGGSLERTNPLPPVPKYSVGSQLGWSYGGLRASIDYAKSGIIRSAFLGRPEDLTISIAPTLYNFKLSYDLGSDVLFDSADWLDGTEISFRVNNVTNDFSESIRIIDGVEEPEFLDPTRAYVNGRSFGINIKKTID